MKKFKLFFFIFLLCHSAFSQVLTTEGKEFWLGFMENNTALPVSLELHITAADSTSGKVTIPGLSWSRDFTVQDTSTIIIELPLTAMSDDTEVVERKGVYIESEENISVYALNKRDRSADATAVLPVESLGKNYIVTSYKGIGPSMDSEFLIVGTEDQTEIEIVPSVTTRSGRDADVPFTIELDQGETYLIQSVFDLSGTSVKSLSNQQSDCKNFAVFSGNVWTNIGGCGGAQDHLYEQLYPVRAWGKSFTFVPLETRDGDLIRIVAAEDSTSVKIGDQNSFILNEKQFTTRLMSNPTQIISDKPISIMWYSRSQSCDGQNGDPFMILLSPSEQVISSVTFNALEVVVIDEYYLTVIRKVNESNNVMLDTTLITEFLPVENSEYEYVNLNIDQGSHTLKSDLGFIAYVYGFGPIESFGYAAGASLENLNVEIISLKNSEFNINKTDSVCVDEPIFMAVSRDESFVVTEWKMGDGTSLLGDTISHAYSKPGNYEVVATAKTADGNCGLEQTAKFLVEVPSPKRNILGPVSVCPDNENVPYTSNIPQNFTQKWFVEKGELVTGNDRDTIKVNWGESTEEAEVKLLLTNSIGCVGDTTILPVMVNIRLEPAAPFGLDSLCQTSEPVKYSAFQNPNSEYNWTAEGGNIFSSEEESVEVLWDSYGIKKLYYTESSKLDDVCDGISDTLSVYIERSPLTDIEILTQTSVLQHDSNKVELVYDTLFTSMNIDFGDGVRLDSVSVTENLTYVYKCPDINNLKVEMFTETLCKDLGSDSVVIQVKSPEFHIESVSVEGRDTIEVKYDFALSESYYHDILLIEKFQYSTDSIAVLLDKDGGNLLRKVTGTDSGYYEYRIISNLRCETTSESSTHRSMVLKSSVLEEEISLIWNDYVGWIDGVDEYNLFQSIDSNELASVKATNESQAALTYNADGFRWCFFVEASHSGNNSIKSKSNKVCLDFVPELNLYNVITPNGDQYNDTFIIENILQYPESELKVFNRYGRMVYSSKNYKNIWRGEGLSSGVYYYLLEVNDPRNPTSSYKGIITLLK